MVHLAIDSPSSERPPDFRFLGKCLMYILSRIFFLSYMRLGVSLPFGIFLIVIWSFSLYLQWSETLMYIAPQALPLVPVTNSCSVDPFSLGDSLSRQTSSSVWTSMEQECAKMDIQALEGCSVPNVVHFVWYSGNGFRLDHFLAMKSAYNAMKPDAMFIHGWEFPESNPHFDRAIDELKLKTIKSREVTYVFNNPVKVIEHKSDIIRLETLIRFGGTYLDIDVLVIRPLLDYFGDKETTMPKEHAYGLNNGIIIAKRCSRFLRMWYQTYQTEFDDDCWGCSSILGPKKLADRNPSIINVDYKHIKSDWPDTGNMVFSTNTDPVYWEEAVAVHTFIRGFPDILALSEADLKKLDNNYGRIVRNVLSDKIGF